MTARPCRSTLCGPVAPRSCFARLRQRRRRCACSGDCCWTRRPRSPGGVRRVGTSQGAEAEPRARDRRGPPRSRSSSEKSTVRPRACARGLTDTLRIAARTRRRGHAARPLACGHRRGRRKQPHRLGGREVRRLALHTYAFGTGRRSFRAHNDRATQRLRGTPPQHRRRSSRLTDSDRNLRRDGQAERRCLQRCIRLLHSLAVSNAAESPRRLDGREPHRDSWHALGERLRPRRICGLRACE